MGSFDIFRADGNKRYWSSVDNLGKPVNTGADDYYFVMNKEATVGYLASNREGSMSNSFGTCCDDIYEFNFTRDPKLTLKGSISDGQSEIDGVEVSIYEKIGDEKKLVNKLYSFLIIPGCSRITLVFSVSLRDPLNFLEPNISTISPIMCKIIFFYCF